MTELVFPDRAALRRLADEASVEEVGMDSSGSDRSRPVAYVIEERP